MFQDTFETQVRAAADRAFGVSVTLSQGANTTVPFLAEWENQNYDVLSGEGFETKLQGRDFMFAVAAAAISGVVFEPRKGDFIMLTENGTTKKFALLSLDQRAAVELMPGGQRWLVHTKQVG